jgi:hypothetical protein
MRRLEAPRPSLGLSEISTAVIETKLSERARVLSLAILVLLIAALCRMQMAALLLVPFIFFGCAVYLPDGPLSPSYMYVTAALFLRSGYDCIADYYTASQYWQDVRSASGVLQHVHGLRMVISFCLFAAELLLAYDSWLHRGTRMWEGTRCILAMGCALRLAANWRILKLDGAAASGNVYLPGELDFVPSVVFNVGCMAISLGLSPANRHHLAKSMGALSVVCSLSELPTPPDRRGGASAPSVDGDGGQAGKWRQELVLHPSRPAQQGARGAHAAGDWAACRSNSSAISSAGSELGHALDDVTEQPSSAGAARNSLPTYPIRPQFYQDDRSVRLPASVRTRLRLQVCDGLLTDIDGDVLAPDGAAEGMYVMDEFGSVFTTLAFKQEQQQHELEGAGQSVHHSSLAGGAPVAAAGLLTVSRGKLRSLSNESGHYAPPPSCLHTVLEQLAALGVAELEQVVLETHRRMEYEPPAQGRAGGRRGRGS